MTRGGEIIVVGGGHAGVEASLAATRMGAKVLLVTQDPKAIARASCNPAIGGLAKGHLVKEIDALGGEMGYAADLSGIQFKVLNKSKGRAVWSPRAQIDKSVYSAYIRRTLENQNNLTIIADEVVDICVENGNVTSVKLLGGDDISCSALIIASGTFLAGIIHIGSKSFPAGRFGERSSVGLRRSLLRLGFRLGRLKTGTPPRISRSTIDTSLCKPSLGDVDPQPFSVRTSKTFNPSQDSCFLVDTNVDVHNVINESIHLSAMYSGKISGVGPRYCPSIEDKLVRFSDRTSHQLFLEPECACSEQIYVNGFSTSLPESVQLTALRKIPALAEVEFVRPGYAIEYDYIFPAQLRATLETKSVRGLFFAGQVNGTSGYEEAAAQGLVAGINSVRAMNQESPFVLKRSDAYIGVLIDDLITKNIDEPYRMFTSSAEFRLSLRPDTATRRLTNKGYKIGVVSDMQHEKVKAFLSEVEVVKNTLCSVKPTIDDRKVFPSDYLRKPENSIESLLSVVPSLKKYSREALFTAETDIKYSGYVEQEKRRVDHLKNIESAKIPEGFDYSAVKNLSNESREKLNSVLPETLGQASRIAGVTPSDIALLSIMLNT